ncbi:extracellular solute-binding protein [Gibbsiella dentisursi]|uniref:Extracellular solute-binding protein n=1 Tax=Gibbsiella dentisursi TaxID=796890 RepID=A0ABP7M1L0_9GAMM
MKNIIKMSFIATLFHVAPALAQTPVAGETPSDSLKGKTVTFASYGGVYQDGQVKALDSFVKKSGVKFYSDGPTELAKVKAQVESGNVQWDVVDTGDSMPYVYCGTVFQKLDLSRIDTSNIPKDQVGPCSVPAMNYGVVLMYNKAKYKDHPPTSWHDFFDVKAFPGTRAIPGYGDAEGYVIELALLNDGVAKDKLFPADINRALNKYRAIRDSGDLILWQTGAQSQQLIESAEADMIMVWSGRGMAAVRNGADYAPVWKDWVVVKDQLTIPVGTKNLDAAYALINDYLGKRQQEIMTEATSYSPININSQPKVDSLISQWLTNTPEKQKDAYQPNIPYWVDHNQELTDKWAEFITGN